MFFFLNQNFKQTDYSSNRHIDPVNGQNLDFILTETVLELLAIHPKFAKTKIAFVSQTWRKFNLLAEMID